MFGYQFSYQFNFLFNYKVTLLSLVASMLFSCSNSSEITKKMRASLDKPNVIIFYLDDSGYGDFTHNGNPTIATPTISKLANEGSNFSQFYTSSPACSASRYSLLTGRVPGRSGLDNWVIGPEHPKYLHPKEITIAEGLKQQGYQTAMFGKWHLGSPNKANNMSKDSLPLAHGFDYWFGTNVSHDYANAKLLESTTSGTQFIAGYREVASNLPSHIELSNTLTQRYTDKVVSFIEQNKAEPFFAYVAFNQPHLGLHVAPEFMGKSRRGLLGDVMAEIDASLARVLIAIDKADIKENTLIIFSSDNGPWVKFQQQKHRHYGDVRLDVGYAMPFRDGKGSNWEGGHRVPGIFYWPGTIIAANVEQAPISTLDILPTVFSLTGTPLANDRVIDGRDVSAYLLGSETKVKEADIKPFEFVYSGKLNQATALRVGPWKLVTDTYSQLGDNYGYQASIKTPLLFQVEHDLSESIDRAEEQPQLTKRLSRALAHYQQSIEAQGSYWHKE